MNNLGDWMVHLNARAMLEEAGVLDPCSRAGQRPAPAPRVQRGRRIVALVLAVPISLLAAALLIG